MSFFSILEERINAVNSHLCVGLDPHPEDLPEPSGEAAYTFCRRLIERTADIAAAYKPNSAFFEMLGSEGWQALKNVIDAVDEEIPVILDAKRGDISSTARAYARAFFEELGVDAVTINPYMGADAVRPFLGDPSRGVFLLCKTSNPGARDLQDLRLSTGLAEDLPLTVYERVAELAMKWNDNDNLGLVVGATQVDALAAVRARAPGLWILAPGIGAQGGDMEAAVQAGMRSDGSGLLVPVSRGISRAADPRRAAADLRKDINTVLSRGRSGRRQAQAREEGGHADLMAALLEYGCIKFGEFTLKSGLQSPIYIDLRVLAGRPRLLREVAAAFLPILQELTFDHLAALPYAAMPIATAISLQGKYSMIYPRKEEKDYGTRASVEGEYNSGERAVVIDDLITTGGSKLEGIQKLTSVGLSVEDIVVLIDRESGGQAMLEEKGYRLHAVFKLSEMLDHYQVHQLVPGKEIRRTRRFLAESGGR